MTLLRETTGVRAQCDGCGRSDVGPLAPIDVEAYAVQDPNGPGVVRHHYCTHCALNRGSGQHETLSFGWAAAPTPTVGPNETAQEHEFAMRGAVVESTGRGISPPKDDAERRELERRGFRREDD